IYTALARPGEDDEVRTALAWTQSVLILVVGYGMQLMWRDSQHRVERFLTDPPAGAAALPPAWLGAFAAAVARDGLTRALGRATGQLGNPYGAHPRGGVVSLVVVQLVVLAVPAMLQNMASSRDHAASWLLAAAPRRRRLDFAEGARRAVTLGVVAPVLLAL